MATALVYGTDRKMAYELIALAKEVADSVTVAALGEKVATPEEYVHHGADAVLVVENPNLGNMTTEPIVAALEQAVTKSGATHVFVNATRRGKEIAPRLAARLGAACISSAHKVEKTDGGLAFERMYLGGKALTTEVAKTDVVVATIAPKTMEPLPADAGRTGNVEVLAVDVPAPKVTVVEKKTRGGGGVDIEAAPVVIGAGRGFKNKEDLKLAEALAEATGGQIGCSRPLATDLGWLTDEYWIGLSGKNVKPKLYVAAGISGQIQHTTGIRGSKVIVAVNTNKDAPIFKEADYGIVGDLYKVLPALTDALKKELGK